MIQIPVLAVSEKEFRRFLFRNNLSPRKYYYLHNRQQLCGRERGSILLMFDSYKAHEQYHELIREAKIREFDCIPVL